MADKNIPYFGVGAREILAALFIYAGFWYRTTKLTLETYRPGLIIIVCVVFVGIGTEYWQCGMLNISFNKVLPYIVSAGAGILMVFAVSKMICRTGKLRKLLVFIGDNTLTILTWHFLSFKLVSLSIMWIYGLPITQLAEFPVIEKYAYSGWWGGYFVIGLFAPLTFVNLCILLKNKINW